MGVYNVTLGDGKNINLILGQQGENEVTSVAFDFSAWNTNYGAGTIALSVQRPGDALPYAVDLDVSGTDATWEITDLDTAYKGVGEIQLKYTVGTAVKKSVVYKFTVYRSLGENGEYPSPGQTWQEGIEDDIEGLRTDVDADHDELIDIREGADGVTYPSAGDAVRGQITGLKQDLEDLQEEIEGGGNGLTADLKAALDQLAQKVAYIDEDGQDYYDALHSALYPPASLSSISCVYTQSGTVYDTDSLDSLKSDLVVTAHFSDSTTQTVTNYTLSGTLATGTSTITVSYSGKTTTFTVAVTHQPVFTQKVVDAGTYIGTGMYATQYDGEGGNTNIKEDVYSISNVKSGDKLVLVTGWNTGTSVASEYISTASKTIPSCSDVTFTKNGYSYGLQEMTITSDYDVLYIGINNTGDKAYLELCTWTRESGF